VDLYNDGLKQILDVHAPQKSFSITCRPQAPWFTEALHILKKEKRAAERSWRKSGLEVHKQIYRQACSRLTRKLWISQRTTIINLSLLKLMIKSFLNWWTACSNLSHLKSLPSYDDPAELANKFNLFLIEKIQKLRKTIIVTNCNNSSLDEACSVQFDEFAGVTSDEIKMIILQSPKKSSLLDPVPYHLVTECLDLLLPVITTIIRSSLHLGSVPLPLKSSVILPLIKKKDIDPENCVNYRPIANLPFISKILEKVVVRQVKPRYRN
jgi:hypothetical protein